MGYLLQKAQKEGDFTKYKKYLFIRVFFDILLFIAIIWSFVYTGSYYGEAVNQCITSCPCLNLSESQIPVFGAWTGEGANLTFNESMSGINGTNI